jgi:ribose transport system ATP-binding protein
MDEYMSSPILEAKNISKSFPGVQALDSVSFEVRQHEIVGLVGENGAGKSTLLKILMGAYQPDEGQILVRSKPVQIRSVKEAYEHGLAMVFQEQSLLPNLTVRENIFLGHEDDYIHFGIVNWKKMNIEAKRQLDKMSITISPESVVRNLPFASRQMVELARAIAIEDRSKMEPVIVLDEPTTVLDGNEVKLLFSKLRSLKERAAIIFVSHHLEEVMELTDRIYVFKDGKNVAELKTSEADVHQLHRLMVGRTLQGEYYRQSKQSVPEEDIIVQVEKLSIPGKCKEISFDLHKGEIIGFAGVEGSGREAVCRAIAGMEKPSSGKVIIDGKPLNFDKPVEAIKAGVGYVPADRGGEGLVLYLSIGANITLPNLKLITQRGFINPKLETSTATQWIKRMSIKAPGSDTLCLNLSGGNQQKVVLAKWLASKVKIFVLDHPTRGIDVGAKEEVYELIRELAKQGIAFLLIADTLEETIGLSNIIYTMQDGEITHKVDAPLEGKPTPLDLIEHMM